MKRYGRWQDEIVLVRRAEGSRDADGLWVPGAATGTTERITATEPRRPGARHLGGRFMHAEEAGRRAGAGRVFWLARDVETVRTVVDGAEADADVVEFKGAEWVVISVQEWDGCHMEVMTVRRDDPLPETPVDNHLDASVRRWLRAALTGSPVHSDSDVHVIPGNDRGPSPTGLYASLLLTNEHMEGTGEITQAAGRESVRVDAQSSYRATFYRDGAMEAARRVWTWWRGPDSGMIGARGVTFGDAVDGHVPFSVCEASDPVREDVLVDDALEERVSLVIGVDWRYVGEGDRDAAASVVVEIDDGDRQESLEIVNDGE